MNENNTSEPSRKFQVRVRTKASLGGNNNSPVSTPTNTGAAAAVAAVAAVAVAVGGGGGNSNSNNGATPGTPNIDQVSSTTTTTTTSSPTVTSLLSSSPVTPSTGTSNVAIAKRPIQRRPSAQVNESNAIQMNNGERRGNVVVIGRKSLNSLQNSVGSHSERIIQNAMSLQKRTSLHTLSSSTPNNATSTTTSTATSTNASAMITSTDNNVSSNHPVPTTNNDENKNTKEEETSSLDNNSNATMNSDGYDTEGTNDASPTIENTGSTTESISPNLIVLRERRMQRVRSIANVIKSMGSQIVLDNKLVNLDNQANWRPFKSTLPLLSNTEILDLYEEFPNENEFYFKNVLYSETEAKDPQILMTSAEIQIYNEVVRDLEGNRNPESLMNHIIFEHWDLVIHARKRFDTENIVKRLGKGVDGIDTRRKINPENDELIYNDSAISADGVNKTVHNISKCSKGWKYQLRQWEDKLGYLSMQNTPLESVSLLRPTYPWMKELANYNRLAPI
jgi:hypothetical protein